MSKYTFSQKPANVSSQFNGVTRCSIYPGVRRVKIDVVDKSATPIDCSVLFLLPHLSYLKQYQTMVQQLK